MAQNFILGYGERLTRKIPNPPGGRGKDEPYSEAEAMARLAPMALVAAAEFDQLPALARPADEVVGVVTLHPEWTAKSYYPDRLLSEIGLRSVGSKPVEVRPEKWTRKSDPTAVPSTDLYVAGKRTAFRELADLLSSEDASAVPQVARVEALRAPSASERLKKGLEDGPSDVYEVVLHASPANETDYVIDGFMDFASSLGAEPLMDRRMFAGGLCFLPVLTDRKVALALSQFAFLRAARPLPRLRSVGQIERSVPAAGLPETPLPDEDSVDPNVSIAVFDGGLAASSLDRWANAHEPPRIGPASPGALEHGHNVTSALLFGPLLPGRVSPRPYANVDHYRVIDADTGRYSLELFEVLERIVNVLEQRPYEFVSLSLGPALPAEDDDVHVWTAKLDELLSSGKTLAAVAVGNTGGYDQATGLSRIQVPGDSVNCVAVGAADSSTLDWDRAEYSSIGPGRSPGVIKPDLLSFGGGPREPFYVYGADAPTVSQTMGTSFATPATVRLAAGVRAHFGDQLSPVALKALLISATHSNDHHDRLEVGWGRIPGSLEDFVVCPDRVVRVVYQGLIRPGGWIRASIPVPDGISKGMVHIGATFAFCAPVDPQDPGNYTRAGLEIRFRPHAEKFDNDDAINPSTDSFFQVGDYMHENELRKDAHKWETTLHRRKSKRASSLLRPVFDIHYHARDGGAKSASADELNYALVITLEASRAPDIYNRVLQAYATQLEVMSPTVSIPVTA